MADPVPLKIADRDAAYSAEVVDRLEKLLAAARRGEILSIAYSCDRPGGAVTMGSTRIKDRYALLGYLAHQMHATCQSIDDDAEPSDISGEGA